ncbi:hypothetical protein KP509_32G026700 [Ceratopteris richardii]|uniref:SMP domain-containing protein n=1 Tax=Ceratopteris richardii TaxID=49495 RepID=A0A8T2QSK3_CERRI|nr:hypothetical protein KP509_32G026700 [Ceratopteris richardii]
MSGCCMRLLAQAKRGSSGAYFHRYGAASRRSLATAQPQETVNYGNIPDDLKPKPNPEAKQFNLNQPSPSATTQRAEGDHPKTIGDALEDAASKAGDSRLEVKDARAIQSAEARATGAPSGVLGGPSAHASNLLNNQEGATLGDALKDAKEYMPADKVATQRDAYRVMQAEARNDPRGQVREGGVASSIQDAVDYNKEKGFIPQDNAATSPLGRGRGAGGSS